MQDTFVEHMVTRKENMAARVAFIFLMITAVLFVLLSVIYPIALIPAIICGGLSYLSRQFITIEYEYAYTNDELDIDIIYNQERRKRVLSVDMDNVTEIKRSWNPAEKASDYTSRSDGKETYMLLMNDNGKRSNIIIEPNDDMINAMKRKYSQKFI
ncbi:MAG: hypothetical protein K6A69_03295 [Lachnospiraceae bacterium]|nr:hypothetical protein [Lachnospiraceae bacterium]